MLPINKFQRMTGYENRKGELRHSYTLFLSSALDRVRGQRHKPAALPIGK
jgi:hypothetical protein